MYRFEKHFAIEEARALLPRLRAVFRDAHRRRESALKADQELARQVQQTGQDLGGPLVRSLIYDLLQVEIQIREVQSLGIQIKDFDRGLIDFPHLREGREVFLCWELEEEDIEFWHDLDTGYGGRERL